MDRLGERSFELMLFLLGLMATLSGASVVVGVLISVLALSDDLGRHGPVLPRFLMARSITTRRLAAMLVYAVPRLRFMEKYIRPRWQLPFAIMLVSLLFAPIPLPQPLDTMIRGSDEASHPKAREA